MRISDWSSDVCSSDLAAFRFSGSPPCFTKIPKGKFNTECLPRSLRQVNDKLPSGKLNMQNRIVNERNALQTKGLEHGITAQDNNDMVQRSEKHTSELQSLMRISYAVFCFKQKNKSHKH